MLDNIIANAEPVPEFGPRRRRAEVDAPATRAYPPAGPLGYAPAGPASARGGFSQRSFDGPIGPAFAPAPAYYPPAGPTPRTAAFAPRPYEERARRTPRDSLFHLLQPEPY